jgi:rubrerythrin
MKIKNIVFTLALVAAVFTIGRITAAQDHAKLNPQTQKNLSTAIHGEAFAYAKYLLFAEQARKSGNTQLADLFENTAKVERLEHLREEAELAGVVGSDQDNLKDAIKGESYEVETMYRQFAEQAKAVGDNTVAQRFEEIRQDEMKHRDTFKAELKKLENKASGGK